MKYTHVHIANFIFYEKTRKLNLLALFHGPPTIFSQVNVMVFLSGNQECMDQKLSMSTRKAQNVQWKSVVQVRKEFPTAAMPPCVWSES